MNLIPLKEFESNLVRLFFSKCNTAEIMKSQVSSEQNPCTIVHRPAEAIRRFFFNQTGTCHWIGSFFSSRFYLHGQIITQSTFPAIMAIIASIITLCQDDDVDDDGMVCRSHRAQRGEISGAKTEPAVPYNTHLPLCGCVVCPYLDFTTISYIAFLLYIFMVSSDMPLWCHY